MFSEEWNGNGKLMLECKKCHQTIEDSKSVAYHLIDGILFGWCEPCFINSKIKSTPPEEFPDNDDVRSAKESVSTEEESVLLPA